MPTQIEKLEAYAAHLLDGFIFLRQRYAMLAPMLFSEAVVAKHGAKEKHAGFNILKNSLFLSCSQDIAKLAMDDDERTPSIRNIIGPLSNDALRAELQQRYAKWALSPIDEKDIELVAAIKQLQLRDQAERVTHFGELYCELTKLWSALSTSKAMKSFQTIRDKLTAHTEIRYTADKYQPIDISNLGLKWSDMKVVMDQMQRSVELLGVLVRNAGFAWPMLDEQWASASKEFWNG
jgi:hypothetical protein